MSVAFTKEESAETASETLLPDRTISPHPNLVTEDGFKALEAQLQEARVAYDATSTIEDVNERRRQAASPLRDMRYFGARVRSAQVIPDPASVDIVAFGSTVTFIRDDQRLQKYRIVGEDDGLAGRQQSKLDDALRRVHARGDRHAGPLWRDPRAFPSPPR